MNPRRLRDLVVSLRPSALLYDNTAISSPARAAAILVPLLQNEPQEVFGALFLNAKLQILAYKELHRGTLTGVHVYARDLLTSALLVSAHAVIVAHNHPSGDPTPSLEDLSLTQLLDRACQLLDITLYDHVIVGEGRYCSFKETGRL